MSVLSDKQFLFVVAAIGAGIWWLSRNSEKFNPASQENVVYEGINKVGEAATDDTDWSLGTAIYNGTHDDEGNRTFSWPWEYDSVADDIGG